MVTQSFSGRVYRKRGKGPYRAIDNVTGGIIIAPEIGLPTDKEVEGGRDPSEPSGPTAVFATDA
jgi:hypothetical protein